MHLFATGCFAVTVHLQRCRRHRFRNRPWNQRRAAAKFLALFMGPDRDSVPLFAVACFSPSFAAYGSELWGQDTRRLTAPHGLPLLAYGRPHTSARTNLEILVMPFSRRSVLAAAALSATFPALALAGTPHELVRGDPAAGDSAATAFSQRTLGNPRAKVQVVEYFSLTCTHCADFANETMPEVESKLIKTGTVYYIFKDFPLDRLALTAAMVARSLPPEHYAPFIFALFASQDRWAFNPNAKPMAQLEKMAALAGMSSADFQHAIADKKLQMFILEEQQKAEQKYHVDSTPTFIINGKPHAGEMPYKAFARLIAAGGG